MVDVADETCKDSSSSELIMKAPYRSRLTFFQRRWEKCDVAVCRRWLHMLLFPSQRALPISHCFAFSMMRRASVETTEQSRLNDEWQQRVISLLSRPIRRLSRSVVLKQVPRCELVFLALACAFRFASCLYTNFFYISSERHFMDFSPKLYDFPRWAWGASPHMVQSNPFNPSSSTPLPSSTPTQSPARKVFVNEPGAMTNTLFFDETRKKAKNI